MAAHEYPSSLSHGNASLFAHQSAWALVPESILISQFFFEEQRMYNFLLNQKGPITSCDGPVHNRVFQLYLNILC